MIIEYYEEWKKWNILDWHDVMNLPEDEKTRYFNSSLKRTRARWDCINKYGFAIPNQEALNAIKNLNRPIIEIGAGTGYWAYLLRSIGVDIVAVDNNSGDYFQDPKIWTDIVIGNHKEVLNHPDRILFTCWPLNYLNSLEKLYQNDYMIYVGEECCDNWNDDTWEIQEEIEIPQWEFIHDGLLILKRKSL